MKLRQRNEAFDLEVYALAALYIGGPPLLQRLPEPAASLARSAAEAQEPEEFEEAFEAAVAAMNRKRQK